MSLAGIYKMITDIQKCKNAFRRMKYCVGVNKNRQCVCVIGGRH